MTSLLSLASVPRALVHRDTTGAGDAFAAGYIAAVMEGRSVGEALAMGNRVAAGVLTRLLP